MGLVKRVKRKTNLTLVYNTVKNRLKFLSKSPDHFISEFFGKFAPLSTLNRGLSHFNLKSAHQRNFLRLAFLKVVLPIEVLRSLCLFPPKGVRLDHWVCFASPCMSFDKYRCQNSKILKVIRQYLNHPDNLSADYYDSFGATWGNYQRLNPFSERRSQQQGDYSPLILFPVKQLPYFVKEKIASFFSHQREYVSVIDKLFICPDHFGFKSNNGLDLSLRSDSVFNYSLEYLVEALNQNPNTFRVGRKGWKNLPYLPVLVSQLKDKPSFGDLPPVTSETLSLVAESLPEMSNNFSYETELDAILAGSSTLPLENEYLPK